MRQRFISLIQCAIRCSALWAGLVGVTAAAASDLVTVALSWDASADENVVGYRIYQGVASRTYTNMVDAGNATEAIMSGSWAGSTCYFAATAYNSAGLESVYSDEVTYTVPGPVGGVTNPPPTPGTNNGPPVGGATNPPPTEVGSGEPPTGGTYAGLFCGDAGVAPDQAGLFSLVVTAKGGYSGRIQLRSHRYGFSGRLDPLHRVANTLRLPAGHSLRVELEVKAGDDTNVVSGMVIGDTWTASLSGGRAVYSRSRPAPSAGRSTFIIAGRLDDPALPGGDSYGTIRVSVGGVVRLAGSLADGTRISASAPLAGDVQWPCCSGLYSGQGLVFGWITFAADPAGAPHGMLTWIRPAIPPAQYYPDGFTNHSAMVGSRYTPPPARSPVLDLVEASLAIRGGDFAGNLTNAVLFAPGGKVGVPGAATPSLAFARASGLFKGKVIDPETGRKQSFGGVALQSQNAAFGFLLGTRQSSEVTLTPGAP
jgi:hypothetical protein